VEECEVAWGEAGEQLVQVSHVQREHGLRFWFRECGLQYCVFGQFFFSLLPVCEGFNIACFTVFKLSLKRLGGAGESAVKVKSGDSARASPWNTTKQKTSSTSCASSATKASKTPSDTHNS
jgi:hypothetical protein